MNSIDNSVLAAFLSRSNIKMMTKQWQAEAQPIVSVVSSQESYKS